MKHTILNICLCAVSTLAPCGTLSAAVNSVQETTEIAPKDAYKAVVKVITYNADGEKLATGTGVFIDEKGICVAPYMLFKGAARAEVFDFKANRLNVERIVGANSNYDLVTFTTSGGKKIAFFDIDNAFSATAGMPLTLLHYSMNKKSGKTPVNITKSDKYNDYTYLYTTAANTEENFGCPLMDAAGKLVGFVQKNVKEGAEGACAIDARFIGKLGTGSGNLLNTDLRSINIPKALPDDEKDALLALYMISSADSLTAITAFNDFTAAFPENAEGYMLRGAFFASHQNYDGCEENFKAAFERAGGEASTVGVDAVHNELSKIIYQKALYNPNPVYNDWTLTRAAQEAEQAYTAKPAANYLLQWGRCLFSDRKFVEAHDKFLKLAQESSNTKDGNWSSVAQAENWFYAARSLELAGGDSLLVISLLDSCITKCSKPYTRTSAPYFLERAQRLQQAGELRRAVLDYNEYEKIVGPSNLNATFYYLREQLEVEARMYQQAMDDIRVAILREPNEPLYKIEEALLLLRVGMFDESIAACKQLLKTLPDSSDAYKIMGIAYGEQGKKVQARTALKKAKELGDATAEAYLEKYK